MFYACLHICVETSAFDRSQFRVGALLSPWFYIPQVHKRKPVSLCHICDIIQPQHTKLSFFTMTHEVTKVTSMVSKLTSGVLISHIFHIIPWQLSHCQKWPWPSVWGSRTPSNDPLLGSSDILGHSGVGNKYDMKWTVSTNDQPKIRKNVTTARNCS